MSFIPEDPSLKAKFCCYSWLSCSGPEEADKTKMSSFRQWYPTFWSTNYSAKAPIVIFSISFSSPGANSNLLAQTSSKGRMMSRMTDCDKFLMIK